MACPPPEVLADAIGGRAAAAARADVLDHAATCSECMAAIAVLASAPASTEPVAVPRRLDRYELGREIGSGGMGVVYAARDTELGREVAIKLLRPHVTAARLRREAQALAKLAHPNVVRIYDVGEHDGQVFIAMELVEGDTLRTWLAPTRTHAEIIDVLVLAARGLAAAHEAGIVHRDFKPDNVFVGDAGNVLVGDFGLARSIDPSPSEDGAPPPVAASELESSDLMTLTRTGAFVGTPAYTAPEQYRGGEVTGAADQFAFCVTAWEALYGARPFQGDSIAEVRARIGAGTIEVVAGRDVPARIEAALRRGLAAQPGDRFPSMAALIAAIAPPAKRRWPWIAGAAMLAATGTAATFIVTQRSANVDCEATAALISPVWNAGVAAQLTRVRTAALADSFGKYAARWQDQRVDACRATHERHEQPVEQLDRRIACLDQARDILRVTLGAVLDERALPRVNNVLDGLPSLERCRTASSVAIPRPGIAFATSSLEAEITLMNLRVQNGTGLEASSQARLAELRKQATELGFGPTILALSLVDARLAAWRGDTAAAESTLRTTVITAESLGDDFTRARAMAALAKMLADHRLEEATHLASGARAALARAGSDPVVEGDVLEAEVAVAREHKDAEHAAELQNRLIELLRERYGESKPVMNAYLDLSRVWLAVGRYDRADEAGNKAQEVMLHEYPDPNTLEKLVMRRSTDELVAGDFDGALEIEAARLTALRQMPHPPYVEAQILNGYAQLEEIAGRHASAAERYREAIRLWQKVKSEPPDLTLDSSPGDVALREIEAVAGVMFNLFQLGRFDEVVQVARPALANIPTGNAAMDVEAAGIRRTLARALVAKGECPEARTLLEPFVAGKLPIPFSRGALRFALARCLWEDGGTHDRERAIALASDAAADLDEALRVNEPVPSMRIGLQKIRAEIAAVAEWRAAHKERAKVTPPR